MPDPVPLRPAPVLTRKPALTREPAPTPAALWTLRAFVVLVGHRLSSPGPADAKSPWSAADLINNLMNAGLMQAESDGESLTLTMLGITARTAPPQTITALQAWRTAALAHLHHWNA